MGPCGCQVWDRLKPVGERGLDYQHVAITPECALHDHLLHRSPGGSIVAGFQVTPMETCWGNVRENPACSGAWRETALEDDLILNLSRDEGEHAVAYRPDPRGTPCLDGWIEEAQGSAIFVAIRLTT